MMRRHGCCKQNSHVSPVNEIVYPTKEEVVKTYSEETVKHIHPIHTTVVNCHTIKNKHVYPHTTSNENIVNEVDVNNESEVAGVTDQFGGFGSGKCCHKRRRSRWL